MWAVREVADYARGRWRGSAGPLYPQSRGGRPLTGRPPSPETHMSPYYIRHLLCAIVDNHFEVVEPDDDTELTVTVAELLHALRNAFELGQDVRRN